MFEIRIGIAVDLLTNRYDESLQRTVLDQIAVVEVYTVYNMITHPPGRGTGVDGGVTQRAHVTTMVSIPRLVLLLRSSIFKAAGAAVYLDKLWGYIPARHDGI